MTERFMLFLQSKHVFLWLAFALLVGALFIVLFVARDEETYTYIKAVIAPESALKNSEVVVPISLVFGGDMMFDRHIRTSMRSKGLGYILGDFAQVFAKSDVVVANLEGPITGQSSVSETSLAGERNNYVFTFDPRTVDLLKQAHIGIVNIGNNHIMNFGVTGAQSTKEFLTQGGVEYFGSPLPDDVRILLKEIRGTTIAFVNYNQFVTNGRDKAFADIVTAREQLADVIILYTHWGMEYVPASLAIKTLAHEFIDAGADLVIGAHPHIVQEKEIYRGKTIYYSLGNLVFDQYFSKETQRGLLVQAIYDPRANDFSFREIPIILTTTGQTVLADENE